MPRFVYPLLLAVLAIVLSACGPSAQQLQATVEAGITATHTASTATVEADLCSSARLTGFADSVEKLLDRYEAQTEVVGATPRVGLGTPLQRLLDYEDEARTLEVPPLSRQLPAGHPDDDAALSTGLPDVCCPGQGHNHYDGSGRWRAAAGRSPRRSAHHP